MASEKVASTLASNATACAPSSGATTTTVGAVLSACKTTKASTSTRVPVDEAFFVPSARTSKVWVSEVAQSLIKTIRRGCAVEEYRSTV